MSKSLYLLVIVKFNLTLSRFYESIIFHIDNKRKQYLKNRGIYQRINSLMHSTDFFYYFSYHLFEK